MARCVEWQREIMTRWGGTGGYQIRALGGHYAVGYGGETDYSFKYIATYTTLKEAFQRVRGGVLSGGREFVEPWRCTKRVRSKGTQTPIEGLR